MRMKISAGILVFILLIVLSVDIHTIDTNQSANTTESFDVTNFIHKFWNDSIPVCIAQAPDCADLCNRLKENSASACQQFGRKLGISTTYYFMLKGSGTIEKVENEYVLVNVDEHLKVKIATDFIYGNAVRDGSGKVNINNFVNMTDFNRVSVEINQLIKEKVSSPLKKNAKNGQTIEFAGAIEINTEIEHPDEFLIIPISAKVIHGQSK